MKRQVATGDFDFKPYAPGDPVDAEGPYWPFAFDVQDYSAGRAEVHAHLRVRMLERDSEDWCAVYVWAGIPIENVATGRSPNLQCVRSRSDCRHVDKTVLVDVVEAESLRAPNHLPGLSSGLHRR